MKSFLSPHILLSEYYFTDCHRVQGANFPRAFKHFTMTSLECELNEVSPE